MNEPISPALWPLAHLGEQPEPEDITNEREEDPAMQHGSISPQANH